MVDSLVSEIDFVEGLEFARLHLEGSGMENG